MTYFIIGFLAGFLFASLGRADRPERNGHNE